MVRRIVITAFVSIALVCTVVLVCSCDEQEKYETLSFFFDGVPPLEPNDVVEVEGKIVKKSRMFAEDEGAAAQATQQWSVHKPREDCSNCHFERKKGQFTTDTRLIAPVPQLCYDCHATSTKDMGKVVVASSVHGPVAIGDCLWCHNPHKSRYEALLEEPQPKLCYECHEKDAIEDVPGHSAWLESRCTDCHEPHASASKSLLRRGWKARSQ